MLLQSMKNAKAQQETRSNKALLEITISEKHQKNSIQTLITVQAEKVGNENHPMFVEPKSMKKKASTCNSI